MNKPEKSTEFTENPEKTLKICRLPSLGGWGTG